MLASLGCQGVRCSSSSSSSRENLPVHPAGLCQAEAPASRLRPGFPQHAPFITLRHCQRGSRPPPAVLPVPQTCRCRRWARCLQGCGSGVVTRAVLCSRLLSAPTSRGAWAVLLLLYTMLAELHVVEPGDAAGPGRQPRGSLAFAVFLLMFEKGKGDSCVACGSAECLVVGTRAVPEAEGSAHTDRSGKIDTGSLHDRGTPDSGSWCDRSPLRELPLPLKRLICSLVYRA